tara:strand:+ start:15524 stop:17332 length:1809 start_codon:yes stop_codon:yes gene_type:complete
MRIPKKALLLAATQRGEPEAEAIDFDGTNDYLSRSTDLVGNTDSKTFTFSAWVYRFSGNVDVFNNGSLKFQVTTFSDGRFSIQAKNTADTVVLNYTAPAGSVLGLTWYHIVLSVDLSVSGNRAFYINDIEMTRSPSTYANDNIDFTDIGGFAVAGRMSGTSLFPGRLSHVYLDYTYRDLSIEANRRLFITADGKPADGQADLSPILYLPLDDFEAPGVNLGTGGDFTLNGVVGRSGRGPNQWNCVASTFDGGTSDQHLSRSVVANDSFVFTFSAITKVVEDRAYKLYRMVAGSYYIEVNVGYDAASSYQLEAVVYCAGFTWIVRTEHFIKVGMTIAVALSADMRDASKSSLLINNVAVPLTNVFDAPNATIPFSTFTTTEVGKRSSTSLNVYEIGEVYFDTTYTDLASDNPFWDTDAGRPKPVLQVLEETGNTPLIAMPIRADDAGRNYGTGGDFTVNSGPFVGARGASEFWARSVVVDASNYLSHTGITCASLVKWLSTDGGSTWSVSYLNNVTVTNIGNGTDNGVVAHYFGTSEIIDWNQEANTLRFTDAFGCPTEPEVDANTLLYLPFDDPNDLGKNLGTGGDFTVNGTVTPSADVDPN